MIPEDKKKRIESLSTDEMLYEINLGRRSRFQREKFAYLKTCYQKRIEEEKLKNLFKKDKHSNNTKDVINVKQHEKEPKLVWFAWSVAVVVFASMTIWVLKHYFNLGLF